jgi:hypothetical protein
MVDGLIVHLESIKVIKIRGLIIYIEKHLADRRVVHLVVK